MRARLLRRPRVGRLPDDLPPPPAEIPFAKAPNYHVDSMSIVQDESTAAVTDAGGWSYVNAPGDGNFGTLWVNCTHTDTRGGVWTVY